MPSAQFWDQQMNAWNKGDAKLYRQAFAADGAFPNIFGGKWLEVRVGEDDVGDTLRFQKLP